MTDLRNVTILGLMARLNTVLDEGAPTFSPAEAKAWIQDGTILAQLCSRYGEYPEFAPIHQAEASLLRKELREVMEIYCGREDRKMGVRNNGLCLLIGYCLEMLIQRSMKELFPQ